MRSLPTQIKVKVTNNREGWDRGKRQTCAITKLSVSAWIKLKLTNQKRTADDMLMKSLPTQLKVWVTPEMNQKKPDKKHTNLV